MSNVSCILYFLQQMSLFHITWPNSFWTDLVYQIDFKTKAVTVRKKDTSHVIAKIWKQYLST